MTTHYWGIALDPLAPYALELARTADEAGIDLLVVATDGGVDPWTAAVWLAGATTRIQIGVPGTSGADTGLPSVLAKARETLEALAGPRLVGPAVRWTLVDGDVDDLESVGRGVDDQTVVVPVDSPDRLARLIEIVSARVPAPGRSLAQTSRRRPGISYDEVPASLRDLAVEPGDPDFRRLRSGYLRGGAPGLVLRPRTPAEVADAVGFARAHRDVPLGVRSGGHGISGRSTNDGGLVIDLGALDQIEVLDAERRLVRIGPGATWKRVAAALDPYDWALGSGDYGGVGVGGLATAGGIGLMSRKYGLTIDHLRAVELVLADGTRVRASDTEEPDLFWAVRGAGANVGIATAFEFEVDDVRELGYAHLVLVTSDIEQALSTYGRLAAEAPRDTTVFFVTGAPRGGQYYVQLFAIVEDHRPEVIVERLTPFTRVGRLVQQQVELTRYAGVMAQAGDVDETGHHGRGEPVSRSALLPALTPSFARDAAALLASGVVYFFQLRAMGGAISDVPADATAFAHRDSAFQVTAMGGDQEELNTAWDALAHHAEGLYLSFDTDLRPERVEDAFPAPTLRRLRSLKRQVDPTNLFRDNFNIDPGAAVAVRRAG